MEKIRQQEEYISQKFYNKPATPLTEKEKEELFRVHFGIDFEKPIDYEKAVDPSLVALVQRERIQKEMEQYIEKCIIQEYNLSNTDEVYQRWDEFKEKHEI